MVSDAKRKADAKYDRTHTKGYYLKLNIGTDADIIAHLDGMTGRQTYIKELIRADMKKAQ